MSKSTFRVAGERGNVPIVAGVAVMAIALAGMGAMMAIMMSNHGGMMGGWWRTGSGADQTPVVATASEVTVDIRDFVYVPADLTVSAGTLVTWVNHDSAPHTATGASSSWDTGRLDGNDRGSVVFGEPGSFPYFCAYHPNMKAVVTVR
jgi:plastocyanin